MDALVGQPRKLNVRSFHKNLFNHYRNFWNYHNYCFISTRTIKVCFETCFMCIPFQRASQGAINIMINIMWWHFLLTIDGFNCSFIIVLWENLVVLASALWREVDWSRRQEEEKWNRGHNVKKQHFSFCGQRKFCEVIWGLIFVFCCFLSFNIMTPPLS